MTFPVIFAQLTGGVQPLSKFDQMFGVVGGMGTVFCTASGASTIVLTPTANMPTISAYTNNQAFGFTATADSAGAVTLNVSGVGALPAYASDATTQLNAGNLVTGVYYLFAYNAILNSGMGGFQILSNSTAAGVAIKSVNVQTFTVAGSYTYVPTVGMLFNISECFGAGGAGGSTASGSGVTGGGGGGGGTGGYSRHLATAAAIGASKAVVVGAGGVPAAAGNNAGGAGGDTSLGTLCIAKGGSGGNGSAGSFGIGGLGGVAGTGNIVEAPGAPGLNAYGITNGAQGAIGGTGGSTLVGGGGVGINTSSGTNGTAATGFGAGGSGGQQVGSSTAAGGAGAGGYVIITEFIS